MFIVLLRFSTQENKARELVAAHKEWLERGFEDRVFLVAGTLERGLGGAMVAHGTTRAELEQRIQSDPFVQQNVVTAELLEVTPSKTDPHLAFLV